jgi:hypothetical protein
MLEGVVQLALELTARQFQRVFSTYKPNSNLSCSAGALLGMQEKTSFENF